MSKCILEILAERPACEHHWHIFKGALWQVLHDGEVVQECCKCHAQRTVHREHAHER